MLEVAASGAPVRTRRPVVSSAILGTLIFVVSEVMFFSGAISAFTISRNSAPPGTWPGVGLPRLPAEATALNTMLLLLSGVVLLFANRLYRKGSPHAQWATLGAWSLGAAFVALQGVEWAGLLSQGLTLTSSALGGFFHLIVGAHAVHAIVALLILGYAWLQMARGKRNQGTFFGAQTFWYFVVLMWPVIYARVYF